VRDASLVLEDAVLRDSLSSEPAGVFGRGLSISGSTSEATLTRVALEDKRDSAIASFGANLTLQDVSIDRTIERACAQRSGCYAFGHGMGVYGGSLTADMLRIRAADLCGLQIAFDAEVDLANGLVAGTRIGACVQIDGYDLSRLSTDVRYTENGINLDATTLPVPSPTSSL
jgi:hypothetical protein